MGFYELIDSLRVIGLVVMTLPLQGRDPKFKSWMAHFASEGDYKYSD